MARSPPAGRALRARSSRVEHPDEGISVRDFDGDRKTDVFRANGAQWFYSSGGAASWRPLAVSRLGVGDLRFGDFDGDGRTDVFSLANGQWSVSDGGSAGWRRLNARLSSNLASLVFADFNGDHKTDIARSSNGNWQVSGMADRMAGAAVQTTREPRRRDAVRRLHRRRSRRRPSIRHQGAGAPAWARAARKSRPASRRPAVLPAVGVRSSTVRHLVDGGRALARPVRPERLRAGVETSRGPDSRQPDALAPAAAAAAAARPRAPRGRGRERRPGRGAAAARRRAVLARAAAVRRRRARPLGAERGRPLRPGGASPRFPRRPRRRRARPGRSRRAQPRKCFVGSSSVDAVDRRPLFGGGASARSSRSSSASRSSLAGPSMYPRGTVEPYPDFAACTSSRKAERKSRTIWDLLTGWKSRLHLGLQAASFVAPPAGKGRGEVSRFRVVAGFAIANRSWRRYGRPRPSHAARPCKAQGYRSMEGRATGDHSVGL